MPDFSGKVWSPTVYLERLSECGKPSLFQPLFCQRSTSSTYVWLWGLSANFFWGATGVARFCPIVYLHSDGNNVSKGASNIPKVYSCPTSHSPSHARNPIWNEIPQLKITSSKVYLSLMSSDEQSNSKQRRCIRIGHLFRRGWVEQAIGEQLLAYYGRRETGLCSMFTPTYDHINTNYKFPNSKFPDSRRVYSIKQFMYIYSIKQTFVKLIIPSSIDKIALAYFA